MGILDHLKQNYIPKGYYKRQVSEAKHFSSEEKELIERIVVTNKNEATIFMRDGSIKKVNLSYMDQDIPDGEVLDLDKCLIYRQPARTNVIDKTAANRLDVLHYEGLDFTPDWTTISSQSVNDFYNDNIKYIYIKAMDYGLSAKITLSSGKVAFLGINRDSRILEVEERVLPKDCSVTVLRKYHTKKYTCLLVK